MTFRKYCFKLNWLPGLQTFFSDVKSKHSFNKTRNCKEHREENRKQSFIIMS